MPRKAIDSRIPALIRNGVQEKKRSFIVVVGDRAKDVIVHLHYIMASVDIKQNRSVLWAYKKDLLGFTSHRKKREAKIRKEIKRGIRDPDTEDPFELFVTLHNIRYVYYKETDKILGNTYGMCILQDFEAITPNLLARTVETVEGGGLVLLLLKGMKSLKQLYTMSMDVHSRYRTEAHDDVVARFNERFILSLGNCESCLVVDDELNVLPISGGKNVQPLPPPSSESENVLPTQKELKEIKDSLADSRPVGPLINLAKTVDQAKALLTFVDAISEKTLRSTVTLTAARGRGKSAALGVAVAAAIAHGYSNIFITSPSPENLKTLFEFIIKGFDTLEYMDHVDYTILQSTNPDYNKAIVRINVHRQHRQTIQYIQPQDAHVLGQAELVVIDEAAAIPLPLVRKLMGPYLVFMASTINGYEGTGRSLSLKLIQQLREQSRGGVHASGDDVEIADKATGKASKDGQKVYAGGRSLREITLSEPIRYAPGDAVEKWLNRLLCLDATLPKSKMNTQGTPHPSACELVHVNRDTLFSFHPVSEKFLQQMMALYVASHYKNSPNDLQLMSDAPAHQLFVLIPPIPEDANKLPEPLCVIQVALEGRISKKSVLSSLSRGQRAGGDLIPWLVSQQFQDSEFAGLSGSRIVRIATNPEYLNMGYGSRALELLRDFYEGKFTSLSETDEATIEDTEHMPRVTDAELEESNLLDDNIRVRDIHQMPPLFSKLSERRPDHLDYLGVSFGLTQPLHKFWKRHSFAPVYLRQTPNELTGEHSCVMLRPLSTSTTTDNSWLAAYAQDFHRRFLTLLSYQFRTFPSVQGLSISESASRATQSAPEDPSLPNVRPLTKVDLDALFSPFDLARLESYANNLLDYHVILDLLPALAQLYFTVRLKLPPCNVNLSGVQQSILLAIGLQRKDLGEVEKELNLPSNQLLAMFVKVVRKISTALRAVVSGEVEASLGEKKEIEINGEEAIEPKPVGGRVHIAPLGPVNGEGDTEEYGEEADPGVREKQRAMIDALPLDKYEISTTSAADNRAWEQAERQVRAAGNSNVVSVKSAGKLKRKIDDDDKAGAEDGLRGMDRLSAGDDHGRERRKKKKGGTEGDGVRRKKKKGTEKKRKV
ncbi:tRNA(Met) cytidine acetyltransferase [Cladophialophora psammophila CBS 110553]|uniref:RNA cytidine acetyltransferase n=1 Tax=Cladophialophora psammophila CBS 110553 TaxID=1182543 RepID=W9WRL2_9EURO|nr:tRNA(Met) cytidine acetyltransferase [Cladophialophora psammophila CBS 110553]EXJ67311.1 tRNA(Met) cytidine acetyltransferase [Cladophialophora psammophila CBS 110553]